MLDSPNNMAMMNPPAASSSPMQPQQPGQVAKVKTSTATALVGVVTLLVVLVRKGKISKARLAELAAATLGGLLSSSCCTIQLVLNSISMGCAGFAVLDRFRPFFLLATFSSLAYKTWRYDVRMHKDPLRSLPTWLIALTLACSPSIVRHVNRWGGLQQQQQQLFIEHKEQQAAVALPLLKFKVEGMKCEACGNGLKNALQAIDGEDCGVQADVLFAEGIVYVDGRKTKKDGQGLEEAVVDVMRAKGYSCVRVDYDRTSTSAPEGNGAMSSSLPIP